MRLAVTPFQSVSQHLLSPHCRWCSHRAPLSPLSQLRCRARHGERRGGRRAAASSVTAVTAINSGNHSAQSWRHCARAVRCAGRGAECRCALRSALSRPGRCPESIIPALRRRRDALDARCVASHCRRSGRAGSLRRWRSGRCRWPSSAAAGAEPTRWRYGHHGDGRVVESSLQQCGIVVVESAVAVRSRCAIVSSGPVPVGSAAAGLRRCRARHVQCKFQ